MTEFHHELDDLPGGIRPKRYADWSLDGNDRSLAEQIDGISHRVKMAVPGDVLEFRPGTEEIVIDGIRNISLAWVLECLVELEILEVDSEGRYVKQAINFGAYSENKHLVSFSAQEFDKMRKSREEQLDLSREADMSVLVSNYLELAERETRIKFGAPNLESVARLLVDEAVALIGQYFPVSLDKSRERTMLFNTLSGLFLRTIAGSIVGNSMPEDKRKTVANNWALKAIDAIKNHPSNTRALNERWRRESDVE